MRVCLGRVHGLLLAVLHVGLRVRRGLLSAVHMPAPCNIFFHIGAGVNVGDRTKATPMHIAARVGHTHIVELLHSKNGDINSVDERGQTPLHEACAKGGLAYVSLV